MPVPRGGSGPSNRSQTWYRFPRCGSVRSPRLEPALPRADRWGRAARASPLHLRRVVPALPGIVGEVVDLADPVRKDLVAGDQVLGPDTGGVGEHERRAFNRPADRPPDVGLEDAGAGLREAFRLGLAEEVAHALRPALQRVVDMDPARRAAQPVAVARAAP